MLKLIAIPLNIAVILMFAYLLGTVQTQPKTEMQARIDCLVAQAIYEQNQ
jgi:hypothetical protein